MSKQLRSKSVFVLCQNDYPFKVYETKTGAEVAKRHYQRKELKNPGTLSKPRIYYHWHEVPLIKSRYK